jgi:hypothetical protein
MFISPFDDYIIEGKGSQFHKPLEVIEFNVYKGLFGIILKALYRGNQSILCFQRALAHAEILFPFPHPLLV